MVKKISYIWVDPLTKVPRCFQFHFFDPGGFTTVRFFGKHQSTFEQRSIDPCT